MGVAHLLALPRHVAELAAVGPHVPLTRPDRVVVYGHTLPGDPEADVETAAMASLGIPHVPARDVHADPHGAAARALALADRDDAGFVVHCDVDVLRFVDAPLADVPDSGGDPEGLSVGELTTALAAFAAAPGFRGLVLTEINPDHVPDPPVLDRFIGDLTEALGAPRGTPTKAQVKSRT
jgi:arginase